MSRGDESKQESSRKERQHTEGGRQAAKELLERREYLWKY